MGTSRQQLRILSHQLLAGGSVAAESAGVDIYLAAAACEKLRVPLSKLAGTAGFTTLLARAVAMAINLDPLLQPLRVQMDGSLTGMDEVRRGLNGSHIGHHGGEIVLTELLGLLVSFVGESLTLTLVREAWPDASIEPIATDSSKEIP